MRPVKTMAAVLLSAVVAFTAVVLPTGSASAAPIAATASTVVTAAAAADSTCPFTRSLCLWDGTDFTGTRFNVQALDPSVGACVNLASHGWGNGRAKSAKNTANQVARLYTNTNCTGSSYQLIPGGGYTPINFASNSVYVY
jgi:hypothetical protein